MSNTRLQFQFKRRKGPPPTTLILLLQLFLFILSISVYCSKPSFCLALPAVAAVVAALPTHPKSQHYKWSQSVESATGIASSMETSSSSTSFSRYNDDDDDALPSLVLRSKKRIRNVNPYNHQAVAVADIFASYPRFISWKNVTFGFCSMKPRVVATTKKNNNKNSNTKNCWDVYNPLLGVTFLTFGPPIHTTVVQQTTNNHKLSSSSRRTNGSTSGVFSRIKQLVSSSVGTPTNRTTIVVTQIPIVGGLLVNNKNRKRVSKLSNDDDGTRTQQSLDHGSLRFEFQQDVAFSTSTSTATDDDTRDGDDRHQIQITTGLKTQIVGYNPAIVGDAPVNPIRKVVYLSSQRLVHAYVMYRFHAYASSELNSRVQM